MSAVKLRLLRSSFAAPEATDLAALMERAGLGDEQAFSLLYDDLAPMLYGTVLRVVRDPSMAEEVTQEVFVELWRLAARFDAERGSVRSWAAVIAHRRAVDRVRSEQSRRTRETSDQTRSYSPPTDVVSDAVTAEDERTLVRQALDHLTPAQREAVTLAYYGGRTYREVAAMLDLPEGTVKTRIRDGLIKLRDHTGLQS